MGNLTWGRNLTCDGPLILRVDLAIRRSSENVDP